ncbi:Nucleoside 2-deoxyribosyltransferase like [Popillia japonica]|uniref:Nucleoside 2-deoxyribosyltransferase like n=1 Tax=Popillia japonica TaxID=7064 RepID=A0AAW1KQ28_POPJA
MHLYPSKPQVTEMLQCARQCSRRNGTYLTFGEFCLFAREMQNGKLRKTSQKPKRCSSKCEVFLGGSCNPTTWRTDTAIPELQKHGITYYNPQVSMWAPELVAEEHDAKQSASVLLYVIDSQTRSVGGMIEVALKNTMRNSQHRFCFATGRCVVLVAYPYKCGQTIMGEFITKQECVDLVDGQTTLLALVKSRGIKVHGNLGSAIQTTADFLKSSSLNNGMTAEELITYKLRKLRQAFDLHDTKGTDRW